MISCEHDDIYLKDCNEKEVPICKCCIRDIQFNYKVLSNIVFSACIISVFGFIFLFLSLSRDITSEMVFSIILVSAPWFIFIII